MDICDILEEISKKNFRYSGMFANDLRKMLNQKELIVAYVKSNGETVTRRATTNPEIIKQQNVKAVEINRTSADSDHLIHYFDLTIGDWRCFDVMRLKEIVDLTKEDEDGYDGEDDFR